MARLGGSLFVHNAIKYDYCYREAIASLCNLCDEVVVIDAESDDGTLAELHTLEQMFGNLKVYGGYKWECEREGKQGKDRIAVLQNEAQMLVDCDWHITLQADEVIHEDSYPFIKWFIENTKGDTALNTRVNLYKDFNHYVRFDSDKKPCSDQIMRLAKKGIPSYGDGESVAGNVLDVSIVNEFVIMHYGMVRKPDVFVDKIIDMQTWFGCGVDYRAVELKKEGKAYKPDMFLPDSELDLLRWSHPKIMTEWITEREVYVEKLNKAENLSEKIVSSLKDAMDSKSGATNETLNVPSFSSNRIRHFLNNLCGSIDGLNYLEVGLYRGGTFVNALTGNLGSINMAYGIDNWSEFEGNREECIGTIRKFLDDPKVKLFDIDCFLLDLSYIKEKINVFFYDGNHSEDSQQKAFTYFNPVLADTFVAIVDDWNWEFVRSGTRKAFDQLGYKVVQEFEMLTPNNGDAATWWNGFFVAVIQK